jgi:UDP-glucose-4-epimerase GalE
VKSRCALEELEQVAPSIFVFGGAGYIGSHVCKALYQTGFHPVTIDNLSEGFRENVLFGPFHEMDLSDKNEIRKLFRQYKPLAVIHLAAFLSVAESVKNPSKYYTNNVEATLSLLEVILEIGPLPVVFSSSAAVYGTALECPIQETHPLNPLNPYGHTKKIIEQVLSDFKLAYGLPSVSFRYFNAAGADPDLELGPRRFKPFHLIPILVKTLATRQSQFEVYGCDYPTPDGSCIRDYVHVSDLASAHVKAVERLLKGQNLPLAINLGTGKGYSVFEVHAAMENVSGQKIPLVKALARPGDGANLVASCQLAHEALQWQPKCSDLSTLCQSEWDWHCRLHQVSSRLPSGSA